jgi:prlF antitoxin for toxin YhaV_toxin
MRISVVDNSDTDCEEDLIVSAFLCFLEKDMGKNAATITPLDAASIDRAKSLNAGVAVTDDELD